MAGKIITRAVLVGCFLVYMFLVCWILFVTVGHTDRSTYFVNADNNFLPFQGTAGLISMARKYNFQGYYLNMLIRNLAGNFFLLFPWGMLLPIIFPKIARIRYVALSAFCFSLSAETTQYVFSLGIFDIDDIILNTIGAITGFIFLRWIIQLKTRHTGMVNSQPKKYVNE